jgi:hypothetical protein
VFRCMVVRINDAADDDETRQQLWPLLPRLIGTRDPDPAARNRVSVALAAWSAEQALPLITDPGRRETAASRIARARGWLSGLADADAAYDAYADAAAAAAADADAYAEIEFLTRLLDEYDRITGRTETPPIPDTTWAQFRATIGTNRKTA